MWAELAPVGRSARTNGYFRQPWTAPENELRAWFVEEAERRGSASRSTASATCWPGGRRRDELGARRVLTGSHLDSVRDGGAYDGPLGVVSALAAVDLLRERGFAPTRPIVVSAFAEEEGSRFGRACLGSRLAVGALSWASARELRDREGVALPDALAAAGLDPGETGPRRRPGLADRLLRRAARRAGPRPGRPRGGDRGGQRDLAARALPLRLHRRGQPRGHDPHGGPARPDADLRDDRAGRQQAGAGWPASERPSGASRPSPTAPTPCPRGSPRGSTRAATPTPRCPSWSMP